CHIAALLHRGVETAHPPGLCGGWDAIRVDERPVWEGIREVLHPVLTDALGELEGRVLLLRAPLAAREVRWLQALTRADGLLERWAARVQRRAVRHRIDGELPRRARVRELADPVAAHALGELHRLLSTGQGAAAAAAGVGGCARTA